MENQLLQKAKETFGTSEKCNLSTFLLPDGTVLNSDKYFNQHPDYHLHDKIIDKIDFNLGTVEFMKQTGAIRYHPTKNNINITIDVSNPITENQLGFLEACSCYKKGKEKKIMYDFYNKEKFVGHNWTGNESDCFKGIDKIKKEVNEFRSNPKLLMIMDGKRFHARDGNW